MQVNRGVDYKKVFDKNEQEKKKEDLDRKKSLRKVKKKRNRILLFTLGLMIVALYMFSEYSNTRIVMINGSSVFSKQELLDMAKIEYNKKMVLYPNFLIEKRLEENVFIEEANVSKSWDGIITISLVEKDVLGYYIEEGESYLLVKGEESKLIANGISLKNVPFIYDLDEKQREKYVKSCEDVDVQYLSLISEISHYETSYDDNMLQLSMQDGHSVYTTMDGFQLLNWYTTTIKGVSSANKCIMFIEETNTITTQDCESLNNEEVTSDEEVKKNPE